MKSIYPIDHFNIEDSHEIGATLALFGELTHNHIRTLTTDVIPHEVLSEFLKENDLDRKIDQLLEAASPHSPELFQNTSLLITRAIQSAPFKNSRLDELSKQLRKHTRVEHVNLRVDIIPFKVVHEHHAYSHEIRIHEIRELEPALKQLWVELFSPSFIKKYLEEQVHYTDFYVVISVKPVHNWNASVMTYYDKQTKQYLVTALPGEQREFYLRSKANQISLDTLRVDADTVEITQIAPTRPKTQGRYKGIHYEEVPSDDTYLEKDLIPAVGSLILKHKETVKVSPSSQLLEWRLHGKMWILADLYSFAQLETEDPNTNTEIVAYGKSLFPGLVTGTLHIIESTVDLDQEKINLEDIIVMSNVPQNQIEVLNKAQALIIENSVKDEVFLSQRISVPTISEVKNARILLRKYPIVTVNASLGHVSLPGPVISGENVASSTITKPQPKTSVIDEKPIVTATRFLSQLSNAAHLDRVRTDFIDGVLFRPEEVLAEVNIHPKRFSTADKTKVKHLLYAELSAIAQKTFPKPLFYQLADFSSEVLRHFKFGELEERNELNPSMGYNGLTRTVIDKMYISLELEVLKSIRNDFGLLNLHLVIPSPRSVTEVTALKRYLNTQKVFNSPSTKQYLEIWVPENLFRIQSYIQAGIQNFIVDTDKLIAALYHFDLANDAIGNKLVFDEEFVTDVLTEFLETIRSRHGETVLRIGHLIPQEKVIDLGVRMGITALASADTAVRIQKQHISRAEFKLLKER